MALYNFVDQVGPAVPAVYLNELDQIRNVVAVPVALTDMTVSVRTDFTRTYAANNEAVRLTSTQPALAWNETDAAANNRVWIMRAQGEQFIFEAVNDAGSSSGTVFLVDRTAAAVDSVTFPSRVEFTKDYSSNNQPAIRLVSNLPMLDFRESNGGADTKVWRFFADGNVFNGQLINDAESAGVNWLTITRTTTTPNLITFQANAVRVQSPGGGQPGIAIVDSNSGTVDSYLRLDKAGAVFAYHGVAGGVNGLVTGAAAGDLVLRAENTNMRFTTNAGASQIFVLASSGAVFFPLIGTTASAANAFLDSGAGNQLLRSTSSLRYKTDVKDLSEDDLGALDKLRPISYRSLCEGDDKELRWFGLIAEEVAEHSPRLVHYTYGEDKIRIPDGVQYERLGVLMLKKLQLMEGRLKGLEEKAGINGR